MEKTDKLVDRFLQLTCSADWELIVDRGMEVKVWRSQLNQHRYKLEGIFNANVFTTFDVLNDIERRTEWDEMTEQARVVQILGPNSRIQHVKIKAVWPTAARDIVMLTTWRQQGQKLFACSESATHELAQEQPGVVRMHAECAGMMCEPKGDKTLVTQIVDGDPRGWVPKSLLNMSTLNLT